MSDEDRKRWFGHFKFTSDNKNGSWRFQILAAGIDAVKTDGMHLLLVLRVAEPDGNDAFKVTRLMDSDPAVAAGLVKVVGVRALDLDERFR